MRVIANNINTARKLQPSGFCVNLAAAHAVSANPITQVKVVLLDIAGLKFVGHPVSVGCPGNSMYPFLASRIAPPQLVWLWGGR